MSNENNGDKTMNNVNDLNKTAPNANTMALPWQVLSLLLPDSIVTLLQDVPLERHVTIRPGLVLAPCEMTFVERGALVRARIATQVLDVLDQVPIISFGELATLIANAFAKGRAGSAVRRELKVVLRAQASRGNLLWDDKNDKNERYVWAPDHNRSLEPKVALFSKPLGGLDRVPVEELAGAIWLIAAQEESGEIDTLLRDVLALYGLKRSGNKIEECLEKAMQFLDWHCSEFTRDENTFICSALSAEAA
jgi:hypothetical protein